MSDNNNEFELAVKIEVSLAEAEIIQSALADAELDDEGVVSNLTEHVKWCIKDAKQKAGYLTAARL